MTLDESDGEIENSQRDMFDSSGDDEASDVDFTMVVPDSQEKKKRGEKHTRVQTPQRKKASSASNSQTSSSSREDILRSPQQVSYVPGNRRSNKRKKDAFDKELLSIIKNPPALSSTNEDTDEDRMWLLSLLPGLKALPVEKREFVKIEIQSLIVKNRFEKKQTTVDLPTLSVTDLSSIGIGLVEHRERGAFDVMNDLQQQQ